MATMSMHGKNLKKSSSLKPKAYDPASWYAALGTQVLFTPFNYQVY